MDRVGMNLTISSTLRRNHGTTPGIHGDLWIDELPDIVARCCDRWSLSNLESPFTDAQYNYVAPAKKTDGESVVLKVVASQGHVWKLSPKLAKLGSVGYGHTDRYGA